MEIIGFNKSGEIDIIEDGVFSSIPDDMNNPKRRYIWDTFEMAPAPEETSDDERVRINIIPPYVEPEPETGPYRLFKSVFINRLTDDEAETMETVLSEAPAKLRLMFNSVEYFVSDDPLFGTLYQTVSSAITPTRADELLAQEDLST